jgi:DNA replication protein DnaC
VACPICRGAGVLRRDVPITHPDFGTLVDCACRVEARQARRWRDALGQSGIGRANEGKTFENYDRQWQPVAWDYCRRFARDAAGWLVLWGHAGNGKTHLLSAIANTLARAERRPIYASADDLIGNLQEGYGAGDFADRLARWREADVLLLDDLGTEGLTDDRASLLFRVLNHRYNERAPLVVATNLKPGDLPARLDSRLRDEQLAAQVTLRTGDYRRRGPK